MIVLSVTSTVSRVAGTPCLRSTSATNSGRSRSVSRRAETLTAIDRSWPRSCQPRRVMTACSMPQRLSRLIRPLFSASGMKTSGLTIAVPRVQPPAERLDGQDVPGAGADLRLEGQDELVVVDRRVQVAEQGQPLDRVAVDLGAVALDVTAVGLGPVERDVRSLEQRLERVGVLRRHRDADAGLHPEPHAVDDHGLAQAGEQVGGHQVRGGRSLDRGEQHRELVPAEPRHGDVVVGERRQPVRHLADHLVTDVVTHGVVDLLEVVEVDEHDRQRVSTRRPGPTPRWPARRSSSRLGRSVSESCMASY